MNRWIDTNAQPPEHGSVVYVRRGSVIFTARVCGSFGDKWTVLDTNGDEAERIAMIDGDAWLPCGAFDEPDDNSLQQQIDQLRRDLLVLITCSGETYGSFARWRFDEALARLREQVGE